MEAVIILGIVGVIFLIGLITSNTSKSTATKSSTTGVTRSENLRNKPVINKSNPKPLTTAPRAPQARVAPPRRAQSKTFAKPMSTHDYVKSSAENSTVLTMTYQKENGETSVRDIEVLAYGPLYFDAYDHLRGQMRTFRTDRVSNIKANSSLSSKSRQYSPSKFLQSNVIGRSNNAN